MGLRQPARAGVVEIREGAALQFLRAGIRRIELGVPLLYKFAGGLSDGLHQQRVFWLMARRPGEGEGFQK